MTVRHVKENPHKQGEDERVAYVLDTTNWGGYSSDATCVLKDSTGVNISETNLSGTIDTTGVLITSPLVIGLTAGEDYRLEFKWVYSGNTLEAWLDIEAEE